MTIKELRRVGMGGKAYFVDIRLSEFRSDVKENALIETIPFKSEKGDFMLSQLITQDFFSDGELSELRV